MNVKLHTVISDIVGHACSAILEAIIAGQRDAEQFLQFVNRGIKADSETIVKSLQGNCRDEHLFTLLEAYRMYQYYRQRFGRCDEQIEKQLQVYEASRHQGQLQSELDEMINERNRGPGKRTILPSMCASIYAVFLG